MLRPTLPFLLAFSSLASAQDLVPDKAIEIELKATDPVLEGHGPSRTFEYDVKRARRCTTTSRSSTTVSACTPRSATARRPKSIVPQ